MDTKDEFTDTKLVPPTPSTPPFILSTRFCMALLVFMAFIVQYCQRVNFPIVITCMINSPRSTLPTIDETTTLPTAFLDQNAIEDETTKMMILEANSVPQIQRYNLFFKEKRFYWTEAQQQLLLGAYWFGYIFTQVPGGWMATNFGAKRVYAISLFTSSLSTLALNIMYFMSDTEFILILILRVLIGLSHGVLFPATVALWSLWAVPTERGRLVSIGFSGTHLGTSITMLIGGLLCRYIISGWIFIFFISTVLGFVWFILWMWKAADSPDVHPTISDEEREYICNITLGGTSKIKKPTMSLSSIPWEKIVKSKPLLALFVTHICNLFGLFFFLTNIGKIMVQVHKIPVQYAGFIAAGGFFLTWLSSLLSGAAVDKLVQTKTMSLTSARKLFNSITSFGPVLCMISLCFCDETTKPLGIVTIVIFLAFSGLGYGAGYVVNFNDIVPAYSGVIFGIANTLASLAGVIGNLVAGIVIKQPTLHNWRYLFILFGIVYFVGGVVYVLFGTAESRTWATFSAVNEKQIANAHNAEESVPMKLSGGNDDEHPDPRV
ncbi:unnamed protein product [Didymodactylos carnosus]|uniref:Major facilitator superfamily (MFS) profile domain-containing protein n=1 Tax=Didymodactylos carnosus TaxID=1234261 RepID=A0A813SLG7_9BILA|nr:unnamed protein product [Didymodactylos carnosus]CAF0797354.1 unnamed protein product [Didymodactylos carnosus]CAF3518314.1 unnamed protein product [Didymodactylos carnosus]CAF3582121.1 unnamed protein product [Didymodactylos carnosus]